MINGPFRGLVYAVLFSTVLWALVVGVVYVVGAWVGWFGE